MVGPDGDDRRVIGVIDAAAAQWQPLELNAVVRDDPVE